MPDTDEHQNLPVVPEPERTHALEIPVAEFEGEYIRTMLGKLPGITLEMDYGYARGTHLKLELEVRVRSLTVDEYTSGKNKGDLYREHMFVIEEAKIVGAYTADEMDPGVGGSASVSAQPEQDEMDDRPEGDTDEHGTAGIPDF